MINFPPINNQLIDSLKSIVAKMGMDIWESEHLLNIIYDCYNFNQDIKLKQACKYCVEQRYVADLVKLNNNEIGNFIQDKIKKESVINDELLSNIIVFLFSVAVSSGKSNISEYPAILQNCKRKKESIFILILKNIKIKFLGLIKQSNFKHINIKDVFSKIDIFLILYVIIGVFGVFYGLAIEYNNVFQSSSDYFYYNLFVIVPQVTWLSLYAVFFKSTIKYWHKASHVTVRSIFIFFTILFLITDCIPLLSLLPDVSIYLYEHINLHSSTHLFSIPEQYKELYDYSKKYIHGINWFSIIITTGGSIFILFKSYTKGLKKIDGYAYYKTKPQINFIPMIWLILGLAISYLIILLVFDSRYKIFNKTKHITESTELDQSLQVEPSFKNWCIDSDIKHNEMARDVQSLQTNKYSILIKDEAMIENAIVYSTIDNTCENDSLWYSANDKLYKYKTLLDGEDVVVDIICYNNNLIGAIVIKPYQDKSALSKFIKFKNYKSLLDLYKEKYKNPSVIHDAVLIRDDESTREEIRNRTTYVWKYENSKIIVSSKYIMYVSDNFIDSLSIGLKEHEFFLKQENLRKAKKQQREKFVNDSLKREEQKRDSIKRIEVHKKSKVDI